MLPLPSQRQRDIRLASAHLLRDETTAVLAKCALRTRENASLVVSEPHVAEGGIRERVEAGSRDRGTRRAQLLVGE
jgi:hypothetical protein